MASSGGIGAASTLKPFMTYVVHLCLYDSERVGHLREAIRRAVRPGDVVVDAGSGTGLLGMFAAQAGARKVYCLELNAEFIPIIEENARRNGLAGQLEAIEADASDYRLPEEVDVVVSEVISAGFFYEPQLQIISNLRPFLKPGGRMVPAVVNNYVELISAQEQMYGLTLNYDSRFTDLPGDRVLTTRAPYLTVDFAEDPIDSRIDRTVRLVAQTDGPATAVKVLYDVEFISGVRVTTSTEFFLSPQIIFLPAPVELRTGHSYDVTLRYLASDTPLACDIEITPADDPRP